MRELDEKKLLNGDVIDGIMMEDKKEVDKVILTGAELSKYFGKETTPREMKDQIIKLLDDWKGQQKEHEKPEKNHFVYLLFVLHHRISPGYAFSRSSDGDINSPEPFPFPGEGAEGVGELLLFPKPKQKWRLNQ